MSEPNFLSLLEGHVGGLVRVKIDDAATRWGRHLDPRIASAHVNGRFGLLLEASPSASGARGAWIVLLVDGGSQLFFVRSGEVEFIGGDGD